MTSLVPSRNPLPRAMCQTITVVTISDSETEKDRYGKPIEVEHSTSYGRCSLQPFFGIPTTEVGGPIEDLVITQWTLYTPPGVVITAHDRVEFGTLDLQVNGDPSEWPWIDESVHHLIFQLKRWEH